MKEYFKGNGAERIMHSFILQTDRQLAFLKNSIEAGILKMLETNLQEHGMAQALY